MPTGYLEELSIVDPIDPTKKAEVTPDKRLSVVNLPPTTPEGKTRVEVIEYSNINTQTDVTFLIPATETLVLQYFSASGEAETDGGNVIELWDDPNGDGSVLNIISVIHCNGSGDERNLPLPEFLGDGVRRIRMRRDRLGGGFGWVFGEFVGYY